MTDVTQQATTTLANIATMLHAARWDVKLTDASNIAAATQQFNALVQDLQSGELVIVTKQPDEAAPEGNDDDS